jgi:hypothetical protein
VSIELAPTAAHVLHPRQLHLGKAHQLLEDPVHALEALAHRGARLDRLEELARTNRDEGQRVRMLAPEPCDQGPPRLDLRVSHSFATPRTRAALTGAVDLLVARPHEAIRSAGLTDRRPLPFAMATR